MSKVLEITRERVIIGNGTDTIFDTNNGYLYRDQSFTLPSEQGKLFTRTLNLNGKQIIPEINTIQNLNKPYRTEDWGDMQISGRDITRPGTPISKPFLEFYTYNGSPETRFYCFLLLVDISPIRQGFHEFYVGTKKFFGFVRKLDKYDHYNWQPTSGTALGSPIHSWVKQPRPLGYGIEVYPGDLYYNYEVSEGDYNVKKVAEKPLLQFLRNLRGGEEIISSLTPVNPGVYDVRIHELPIGFFEQGQDGGQDVFSYSEGYDLLRISPTDALSYIASYPDLIAAYGTGSTSAMITNGQNHWASFAAREGRTLIFNPLAYINKYADIKQQYVVGSKIDFQGATEHYIRFGYAEGRTLEGSSTFFPNARGGLYDERFGAIDVGDDIIIYPNGQTIAGKGNNLTYRFNNTVYYLNGNIPTNEKTLFLRKQ
jgi:hypothetical protein